MISTPKEHAMQREEAIAAFRRLTQLYGTQWTAQVPREAFDELRRINRVLSEADRRQALGLPAPVQRRPWSFMAGSTT